MEFSKIECYFVIPLCHIPETRKAVVNQSNTMSLKISSRPVSELDIPLDIPFLIKFKTT